MTIDELSTAWVVFAGLLGGVFLIDKALDLVKKWRKPSRDIEETLRVHGELLEKDNRRIKALEDNLQATTRVQNRALLQLMNHSIDGNHTEKLKEARDAMEDYLINH